MLEDQEEEVEDTDGWRELKGGRGGRSGKSKKSTRGRVRLYFGQGGSRDGKSCFEERNEFGESEVKCKKGTSTVGIVIAIVVGVICLIVSLCFVWYQCCKNRTKVNDSPSVAHYK